MSSLIPFFKTYRYKSCSIFLSIPLAVARTEAGPPNPPFTPLRVNEVPEGRPPCRPRERFARYKRMVRIYTGKYLIPVLDLQVDLQTEYIHIAVAVTTQGRARAGIVGVLDIGIMDEEMGVTRIHAKILAEFVPEPGRGPYSVGVRYARGAVFLIRNRSLIIGDSATQYPVGAALKDICQSEIVPVSPRVALHPRHRPWESRKRVSVRLPRT